MNDTCSLRVHTADQQMNAPAQVQRHRGKRAIAPSAHRAASDVLHMPASSRERHAARCGARQMESEVKKGNLVCALVRRAAPHRRNSLCSLVARRRINVLTPTADPHQALSTVAGSTRSCCDEPTRAIFPPCILLAIHYQSSNYVESTVA